MQNFEPPIKWTDYEDIAANLYERFVNEITEAMIYRVPFPELLEWVLEIRNFAGERAEANDTHLEMIRNSWVAEWRDNQKPTDSHLK